MENGSDQLCRGENGPAGSRGFEHAAGQEDLRELRRASPGGELPDALSNPIVRVVVVGRTGLEAQLRLDPGVELLRAKSTLDAIGELGEAMADERRAAGADSREKSTTNVVVVAPELDPGTTAAEWISSIRVLDPSARVLLVERAARNGGADSGTEVESGQNTSNRGCWYDGLVREGSSAAEVRRAVRGVGSLQKPPNKVAITQNGHTHASAPQRSSARPGAESRGGAHRDSDGQVRENPDFDRAAEEVDLVRVLLSGGDIASAAMRIIRESFGIDDLVFLAVDANGAAPDTNIARSKERLTIAEVRHNGRLMGWLRSAVHSEPNECTAHSREKLARLDAASAWLGPWLALGEQHSQLRRAAFTDDLTGAYNRRYFDRYLARAIEQAGAARLTVTVLFLDLDNFKRFNDTYGHGAGDDILKETVRLLSSVIRPADRVCRIGGDEFAVIFHEPGGARAPGSKPPDSVSAMTKRFQKQICESRFPKLGKGAPGELSVSGGLATYPWDGRTAEELLERADQLAIESKRQGKNAILLGPGAARECAGE